MPARSQSSGRILAWIAKPAPGRLPSSAKTSISSPPSGRLIPPSPSRIWPACDVRQLASKGRSPSAAGIPRENATSRDSPFGSPAAGVECRQSQFSESSEPAEELHPRESPRVIIERIDNFISFRGAVAVSCQEFSLDALFCHETLKRQAY